MMVHLPLSPHKKSSDASLILCPNSSTERIPARFSFGIAQDGSLSVLDKDGPIHSDA